jgi:predicted Rossmann fold flavoprotein
MLVAQCEEYDVQFWYSTEIDGFEILDEHQFTVETSHGEVLSESLVVATGGLSYASIGASGIGYDIAHSVEIPVHPLAPGLVPFTWSDKDARLYATLSGIATPATICMGSRKFSGNLLFTHRGLSGPVALQISSYWTAGSALQINLLPGLDLFSVLKSQRMRQPQKMLRSILSEYLPKRLLFVFLDEPSANRKLVDCSDRHFQDAANSIQQWQVTPAGTEGYKKAEVTCGGVDCAAISSKTMESLKVPGLYFVGEVLDVTGWLGGYNLQWAWSSGWCAGQYV